MPDDIEGIKSRFLPHQPAPIVVLENGQRRLRQMNFSLIPAWSKEKKVRFATHNARLISVDEKSGKEIPIYKKPTWKNAFVHRHCLVPISEFIEPIYVNQLAGNMVAFYQKDHSPLAAAGIWESWVNKEDGEVIDSFAILTDEPPEFVARVGHERCPVFLRPTAFDGWLSERKIEPEEWIRFLNSNRESLDLDCKVDRPMAKGWEKRIPK